MMGIGRLVGSHVLQHVYLLLLYAAFLSSCSSPEVKHLPCGQSLDLEGVSDIADSGAGFLFVAVQDRSKVDLKNEHLNTGRIVTVNRRTLRIQEPVVRGRDDYPFKPLGIDASRKGRSIYLFVVNEAFRDQPSIEVYTYTGNALQFVKRIRTARMQGITDILLFSDDEFVVVREKPAGFAGKLGDVIYHHNQALHYLPLKTGGASHIHSGGARSVLIANGKGIVRFSLDGRSLQSVAVLSGEAPVQAFLDDGVMYVLHEGDEARFSMDADLYSLPVKDPSAFVVLRPEKKILFGSRKRGLTFCDLPAAAE